MHHLMKVKQVADAFSNKKKKIVNQIHRFESSLMSFISQVFPEVQHILIFGRDKHRNVYIKLLIFPVNLSYCKWKVKSKVIYCILQFRANLVVLYI